MDPDELRVESQRRWERAAPGWGCQRDAFGAATQPVARRLVELAGVAPGQRVLELAAGPGDVGLLAAEQVGPDGEVLVTDFAEPMLGLVRERAEQAGLAQVATRVLDAESMDLAAGAYDAALCRFGYMLMVDPATALGETRRVLRPGGHLALAVWDAPEHNPWLAVPGRLWVELALQERPEPGAPGPFALADPARLLALLGDAGFLDAAVEPVELRFAQPSFADWLASVLDLSDAAAQAFSGLGPRHRAEVEDRLRELLAPWTAPDGALALPGRALVAVAEA